MARRERQAPAADVDAALTELARHSATLGIDLKDRASNQFRIYLETLLLWNRRTSLVSQSNPVDIVRKHFVDSLMTVAFFGDADSIVDLGSGAGFPGLIIAMTRPDLSVCLVDANRKKASFVADVIARTNLHNAMVVEGRIEDVALAEDHREKYAVAIARALASVGEFLGLARPFLHPGGRAVAMKGPRYMAEMQTFDPTRCGFAAPAIEEYELPDGARRVLLSFSIR